MDRRILESQENQPKYTDELLQESSSLFNRLTLNSDAFECNEFTVKLLLFIEKFYRIQYSSLSALVYNSDENTRTTIGINLDSLVNYSNSKSFEKLFYSDDETKKKQTKKILVKLWDHYNLATTQFYDLNRDDFYEKFFNEKQEIEKEFNELINQEGRKISRDLIAMVAIFTAMSFLVFGGLNSLSSILTLSLKELPVLTIGVECLVWGICIYNLIYLFMYLISKLIDKPITSRDSNKFYQKHKVFLIGNLIIFFALSVTGWLYFIQTDFNGWYSSLYGYFGVCTKFLLLFLYLVIFFIAFLIHITKRLIKNTTNKENIE